ncbi:MAG: class I SAM-dependent methyltransferase [Gemmatimonadota bacterium]
MAPFVAEVIAVDESAAMLRAARARLATFEHVEVREGSVEALPLDDGQLDLAVLSLVLHYVADPATALAEIHRVLRPRGGRLLLVDMLPHDREEYRQTMGHVWLGFAPETVAQRATAAGFRSIRQHPLPAASHAKGPTLFAATLST